MSQTNEHEEENVQESEEPGSDALASPSNTADEEEDDDDDDDEEDGDDQDDNQPVPNSVFVSSHGQPYRRDWMRHHNIPATVLDGFTSKLKLDHLFKHGAIILGDKLTVQYITAEGVNAIGEGEVSTQDLYSFTQTPT